MNTASTSIIDRFLCWWGANILRFPWTLILLTICLTAASLYYTINNLGINTNTAEMLSSDLPFQKNRLRIEKAFPQDAGVLILVVDAQTPEITSQAAAKLEQDLKQLSDNFTSVYTPTENDFFKQQALLFLNQKELDALATKLIDAQPFIGYLANHYSLEGLFEIIGTALKRTDKALPMNLEPLLLAVNDAINHQLKGQPYQVSWQNLLAANKLNTNSNRTLVLAKPILNFNEIMPAAHALNAARKVANKLMLNTPGLRIRMTGEVALEHEELESVGKGSITAGVVSLFLVLLSLWVGLRSFKLLFSAFIVLILGLILTAGFATVSISHLNLISIAFAILYIGLGVDFAIHICLHYRECRIQGMDNKQAISDSVHTVGFSLFLCALTTSLGFLAFIPTDYSGVSELGIISAGGMIIGLIISLTVLPALLTIFSIKKLKPIRSIVKLGVIAEIPFQYALQIRIMAVILAIASAAILSQLVFDSNPINLRDPHSESVSTIKELLASQTDSPFALSALAPSFAEAQKLANRLNNLASVHSTIFLGDLVAKNQDEKLETIDELDLILGDQLKNFNHVLSNTNPVKALVALNIALTEALKQQTTIVPRETLEQLQQNITLFQNQYKDSLNSSAKTLEKNILGLLPFTMNRLQTSLSATAYQLSDLPAYITRNWLSPAGQYKVLITPEFDQNKVENLKEFVAEVQTAAPQSSGLPVADQASGTAVVKAFIQAFSAAIIAIFLLLLFILKNIRNTLLVLGPLLLAGLLTGATNVLLNNNFNFANIIALPLLMGMGVDSSIHIFYRLESRLSSHKDLLQSSTARAVFFSSLTTLCSFSSLAFTSHLGTASMGLLLAVGIFFTLVCTLIVLPAFYGNRN